MTEQEDEPVEPSSKPIPDGHVRRFHVTEPKNIPTIKAKGLEARNTSGGVKKVYSWNNYKDAVDYGGQNKAVVEFHHEKVHYQHDPLAWNSSAHATPSVPASHIVAIHHPWHNIYHAAKANNTPPERLRKAGLPEYDRAANALEKK